MKNSFVLKIENLMSSHLNNKQLRKLRETLRFCLHDIEFVETPFRDSEDKNNKILLDSFIAAKEVEGCSDRTLQYYKITIENMLSRIQKEITQIVTDDLRQYLADYHCRKKSSRVTIDNIRRILASFFSWLEDEDYILKSPVRRIRKIKSGQVIKETFTDENIELMMNDCNELRDLAMINLLSSTGMRVGELVLLNKCDIDFQERECIVLGKGGKEREVYFDARTKLYLQNYLNSRNDNNPALFVALSSPHDRLKIGGVETRIRNLGERLGINKAHPHKFRRTLATKAIDKGMPIEQVQRLLGHQKIDTTMHYAMVNQTNVKIAHRRYIG